MKTSEIKNIIKDNGYTFIKNEFGIEVRNVHKELVLSMHTNDTIYVGEGFCFQSKNIKDVMKALIAYSERPLEEREEEKKYYFKFYDGIDNTISDRFLKLDEYDKVFYFSNSYRSKSYMKGMFTENEIENFPSEIKGAIECGFLKKVEVEE